MIRPGGSLAVTARGAAGDVARAPLGHDPLVRCVGGRLRGCAAAAGGGANVG